ncbi:MAG TPA: hypothetical protein VHG72_10915 [Polyangia bacterium]|nr:hypothetical protein [Polyangia bacterium]
MPDPALAPEPLAAEIERRVPALSRRVIEEMYQNPFWGERFGDGGRGHANEDGDFHVRYLAEAARAGSPAVMITYARWLRSVLTARGMCTRHLADNFARLAAAVGAEEMPGRTQVIDLLIEAEAGLLYEAPEPRAIQERAPDLAAAAIGRLQAAHADWYQEGRGWGRCLDDALYHLSYLADAVAMGRADLFMGYLTFISRLFARRAVPAPHLTEMLKALSAALSEGGLALADARAIVDAGAASLERGEPA